MPDSTREALLRLGADPDPIGVDALAWGQLPANVPVRVADPIFPRADISQYIGGTKIVEEQKPTPAAPPPIETTQAAPPTLEKISPEKISIDEFMKVELRVADVRAAERVPKSKKLIQLTVFTGDDERTIVAGIGTKYAPEELVGRKVVIVANLQPAKLMGIESNGMVLAASLDGEPILVAVDPSTPAGTRVR
jgi:methionyl-tRNA synthetase